MANDLEIESVEKYLKANGNYEKSMSTNEMINLYKAIKHSETTLKEETVRETVRKTPRRRCEYKNNNHLIMVTPSSSTKPAKSQKSKSVRKINKSIVVAKEKDKLHQEPRYVTAVYALKNLTSIERYEKLKHIENTFYMELKRLQRKSVHRGKWGDPIITTTTSSPRLNKMENGNPLLPVHTDTTVISSDNCNKKDVYVSRGGRQTKRKTYSDQLLDSGSEEEEECTKKPKMNKEKKHIKKEKPVDDSDDLKIVSHHYLLDKSDTTKRRVTPPRFTNVKKSRGDSCNASSSNSNNRRNATCPICDKEFSKKDIQMHASNCGITSELEIENNLLNISGGSD